jgi:hypothetical protein
MKHLPFHSAYRESFQVVEERRGDLTLYPHTEQLPLISRALNFEFYGALPHRVAQTDHRGDMFRKMCLASGANIFCTHIHRDRPDDVLLFHYKTPELVSKVAIVQHIKESTSHGLVHRFRFFSGTDFLPDIHLNGRRIAFAGHVLERFSKRVPHRLGEGLRDLFNSFYGGYIFRMPLHAGHGFVVPLLSSAITYTFKEKDDEYFITTCLSVRETHGLKLEDPAELMYLHYGRAFTPPTDRKNWKSQPYAEKLFQCWQQQSPVERVDDPPSARDTWMSYARIIRNVTELDGFPEGSWMDFLHQLHGPAIVWFRHTSEDPAPTSTMDLSEAALANTRAEKLKRTVQWK